MKVLEKLERLQNMVDAERARGILSSNGQDYTAIRAMETLPALIRVARAAEAYRNALKTDDDSMNAYYIRMREQGDLDETLQHLRDLGDE